MASVSLCHSVLQSGTTHAGTTPASERLVRLPDDRLIHGTVQDVKPGKIQVNIGELPPVFLSVDAASEKGMPSVRRGDKLTIVVSDENEFIDFRLADQPGRDRVLKGSLIQPVGGDHHQATCEVMS